MKLTVIYKKINEQNNLTPGKIWIKPTKNFNKNGFGFYGSTFNYKDIFNEITQKNKSANDSNNRFYWDKMHKCWWTASERSKEMAKNMFKYRLKKDWQGDQLNFTYNKFAFDVKNNAASPTLDKELENLRKIWTKTNDIYATEISTLEANKAMNCPSCGVKINEKSMIGKYDSENDLTHWLYTCPNCQSKLKIFND